MALTQLNTPFPVFNDLDGTPLDGGFVYIGVAFENPETTPISVYYDRELTQVAAQPLRTMNGYVVRNFAPASVYTDGRFSVTVRDRNGALVFYSPSTFLPDTSGFVLSDRNQKDVAALLADTSLTYTADQDGTVVAGDIIRTLAEGFAYEVAAAGAADQHVTTAGGVKLYVQPTANGYAVKAFGAIGDGATDDTDAIQKAIDVTFASGGGVVLFQEGTYLVTSVGLSWSTSGTSMIFRGEGMNNTVIEKTGTSTSPVMDLQAVVGDGSYSRFENFRVNGISTCTGMYIQNLARCTFHSVRVNGCDTAIENAGSLIMSFYDCELLQNQNGYVSAKFLNVYCNLINFFGGSVRGNQQWGFDLGDANGIYMYGVDFETNGTANASGDGTGGALITRSNCADEFGFSVLGIHSCWFEGNRGTSIVFEDCVGLGISISDTNCLASEDGNAITCGVIGQLVLERFYAPTATDNVDVSAQVLSVRDCTIGVLNNSSLRYIIENLVQNSGATARDEGNSTDTGVAIFNGIRTERGSVTAANATATTIYSPPSDGMYLVYAWIQDAGVNFVANARIANDSTNTIRMGGEDASSLTITISGSNVQVTQSSGVSQSVRYVVQRLA